MSQQQGARRVMVAASGALHFEDHTIEGGVFIEARNCERFGCTPADPLHPDTVRFIRENKEA